MSVPSEAVLKFARNLQELKGLIFDKTQQILVCLKR